MGSLAIWIGWTKMTTHFPNAGAVLGLGFGFGKWGSYASHLEVLDRGSPIECNGNKLLYSCIRNFLVLRPFSSVTQL